MSVTSINGTSHASSAQVRRRVVAVVLGALLMVGIPISRFQSGSVERFGWQMFSHSEIQPVFSVVPESGETYEVETRDFVARLRGDLPLAEFVPPHLCEVVPDARQIIIAIGQDTQSVTCR